MLWRRTLSTVGCGHLIRLAAVLCSLAYNSVPHLQLWIGALHWCHDAVPSNHLALSPPLSLHTFYLCLFVSTWMLLSCSPACSLGQLQLSIPSYPDLA